MDGSGVSPTASDRHIPLGRSLLKMESPKAKTSSGTRKQAAGPASNGVQAARQPKAKRRPAVSQEKPGQTPAFYFVDQGSSTREKRAHVMRHHIQEKRKQSKLASNVDKQANRSSRYLPWRKKQEEEQEPDGQPASSPASSYASESSSSFQIIHAPTGQSSPVTPITPPQIPQVPQVLTPGLLTMLSASRQDPFNSLPIYFDPRDYELADFWTSKLTYWSGQNSHMKNLVFRTAMRHPLSFQAVILAYCARWRAQLYNVPEDPTVSAHVGQAESVVDDSTRGTLRADEESLAMAMTGLSLQEERFGNKRKAEEYAERAVEMIRPRTGSNLPVEIFLLYVRYIMAPRDSVIDTDGGRWLVTFLRSAEQMMAEQNTRQFLSLAPQRRDLFQFESPLYPLLSSGPHPTQVPADSRMYVIRNAPTQEVCRTAALIYITAALWDHRDSPNRTGRFLEQVAFRVKERGLDRYPACESFVWLLLEEVYDPDLKDPERAWSAGELLKMHKLLSPDLQFYFNEILMSFLMLSQPLRGVDAFEDELRRAIP